VPGHQPRRRHRAGRSAAVRHLADYYALDAQVVGLDAGGASVGAERRPRDAKGGRLAFAGPGEVNSTIAILCGSECRLVVAIRGQRYSGRGDSEPAVESTSLFDVSWTSAAAGPADCRVDLSRSSTASGSTATATFCRAPAYPATMADGRNPVARKPRPAPRDAPETGLPAGLTLPEPAANLVV
jgi:hypothetical protein